MKRYLMPFLEKIVLVIKTIYFFKNFPKILVAYLFPNKFKKLKVALWKNLNYEIRMVPSFSDIVIIFEMQKNVYRIEKNDFQESGIVIDVGAHIGVFSTFAIYKAGSKNITVYSFEPDPQNFNLLCQNIKINNLSSQIYPFNLAVFKDNLPKQLIKSKFSSVAHSLIKTHLPTKEIEDLIKVNSVTLADIFEKNNIEKCDVLKLDCEGSEYEILFNTPDNLFSKIRKIVLEYHGERHGNYTPEDLIKFLREKGFEVKRKIINSKNGYLYARQANH